MAEASDEQIDETLQKTIAEHNKAVSEFCESDFKAFPAFAKTIAEITGIDEPIVTPTSPDADTPLPPAPTPPLAVEIRKPLAAFYNKALIYYHHRQYARALEIMRPLLRDVDRLDEKLLQKSGMLAIDCLLRTAQYSAADQLVELLSSKLGGLSKEMVAVKEEEGEEAAAAGGTSRESDKIDNPLEEFRRVFRFKMMMSNVLSGKIVTIPSHDDAVEYAFLRAYQHYQRRELPQAARELTKRFDDPYRLLTHGDDQDVCLANNLGLLHMQARHFAMAAQFFQKALQFETEANAKLAGMKADELPLHAKPSDRSVDILVNLGLALLNQGKPREAFDCFLVSAKRYPRNPRLWYRLAECCAGVHEQRKKADQPKQIVRKAIGSGRHRKLVLEPWNPFYMGEEKVPTQPTCCLGYGLTCVQTTLTLVEENEARLRDVGATSKEWQDTEEQYPCAPSPPMSAESFRELKLSALAMSSYLNLELGEWTKACEDAKQLLAVENLPETYKFLGRIYVAEAMIMDDHEDEALSYLEPKLIKEITGEELKTRLWDIETVDHAQAILSYNLAATLAISGQLDLAAKILTAVKHPTLAYHARSLQVYLELRQGNHDAALQILRFDSPAFFAIP